MIAPALASTAQRPHRIALANPGKAVPNPDGGYTATPEPLDPPALFVRIESPARDDERIAPGFVSTSATRLITGPWHPQVTTQTVLTFNGRTFHVRGVVNREERGIEMILTCEEQLET